MDLEGVESFVTEVPVDELDGGAQVPIRAFLDVHIAGVGWGQAPQLALWRAIKSGNLTVREARAKTSSARSPGKPGPKPYEHKFQPDDRTFTVRVTFRKSRASHDDIKQALRDALKNLT